jgi:uncharacterized protein
MSVSKPNEYDERGKVPDFAPSVSSYHDVISLKDMTRFAENSSTEAMISLGDMYYFGHDTIANVALAIKWYRRAADMNNVEAMYTLAYIYKPPTKGNPQTNPSRLCGFERLGLHNNKWYSKAVSNHEFLNELDRANNALMGDTYYFGRHGVQNHDLAIKYYKQSADAPSMHNLGVIYERIKEDKLESIQWYKKGHEQGYASSTFNLSQLYYVEKNYEKVFELCIEIATPTSQTSNPLKNFEGSSYTNPCLEGCEGSSQTNPSFREGFEGSPGIVAQGSSAAQYRLGVMYYDGKGVEKDHTKAFEWFLESGVQGNPNAQNRLGIMYLDQKNYEKASEWFTRSAEQGNSDAWTNLGVMYEYEKNYTKALELYTRSAEQGDSGAKYHLGMMYYKGNGVKKDYKIASEWFTKSATPDAQYQLGVMYEYGYYVKKDYKKAFELYTLSDNSAAQHRLGIMYLEGNGIKKDYTKAFEWFTKSANPSSGNGLGNSNAQYQLGLMYYDGKGIGTDYVKAIQWFVKSAEQGNSYAKSMLDSSRIDLKKEHRKTLLFRSGTF